MESDGLVHAYVLDGGGGGESLGWEGVESWKPEDGVLWIALDYTAADAQAWLGMRSGLDPIVREALLDRDPRPRALAIGDALLLVIRVINLNTGAEPEDMVSMRCWIEPRRIITLRHRPIRLAKEIAAELVKGKGPHDPGDFVAEMVEQSIEPVIDVVDAIDDQVARAEDEVLGAHGPELRARIADLRRRTIQLRRFIAPQREAFTRLASAAPSWFDETDRARLREAADRLMRTVEELDAARDRAAVTHEEMGSRVGEITNQRLYVLSVISAIFLPLGFLAAVFGVSTGGVPGDGESWGFWAVCGMILALGVVQLVLFRKWKWL